MACFLSQKWGSLDILLVHPSLTALINTNLMLQGAAGSNMNNRFNYSLFSQNLAINKSG